MSNAATPNTNPMSPTHYSYSQHTQVIAEGIPVPTYTPVASPAAAPVPSAVPATPSICHHGGVHYWNPPSIW